MGSFLLSAAKFFGTIFLLVFTLRLVFYTKKVNSKNYSGCINMYYFIFVMGPVEIFPPSSKTWTNAIDNNMYNVL